MDYPVLPLDADLGHVESAPAGQSLAIFLVFAPAESAPRSPNRDGGRWPPETFIPRFSAPVPSRESPEEGGQNPHFAECTFRPLSKSHPAHRGGHLYFYDLDRSRLEVIRDF